MRIDRSAHVQLAMPPGGEALARAFYSGMLDILEIPKPPNLAKRGGCPARKAHPALLVLDLQVLIDRLKAAGHEVREDEPLEGYHRVYVSDPFGNRIELMEPLASPPANL